MSKTTPTYRLIVHGELEFTGPVNLYSVTGEKVPFLLDKGVVSLLDAEGDIYLRGVAESDPARNTGVQVRCMDEWTFKDGMFTVGAAKAKAAEPIVAVEEVEIEAVEEETHEVAEEEAPKATKKKAKK